MSREHLLSIYYEFIIVSWGFFINNYSKLKPLILYIAEFGKFLCICHCLQSCVDFFCALHHKFVCRYHKYSWKPKIKENYLPCHNISDMILMREPCDIVNQSLSYWICSQLYLVMPLSSVLFEASSLMPSNSGKYIVVVPPASALGGWFTSVINKVLYKHCYEWQYVWYQLKTVILLLYHQLLPWVNDLHL